MFSDFLEEWNSELPYVEAHTSGSTGKPKRIRLLKDDMRQSARATNAFFGIDNSSVVSAALSTDYIAGKMMAVRAFESGARLLEVPVAKDIILPDGIDVDLLAVVPAQLPSLYGRPILSHRVSNVLVGGAAPSESDCRRMADAGYKLWISYGMTETCSHVALARGDDPARVFTAMPGISFEADTRGCLVVISQHFSWKRLQTNDVVELLSPVSFRWRGRADGVINSGGIKLFPEELERLYAPYLIDVEYYVCGEPDEVWGERIVLVCTATDAAAILSRLRSAIADHRRLPKRIVYVPELLRTANGKIKRSLYWS